MSRHAGKGISQKLRHLHLPNEDVSIAETLIKREDIEKHTSNHNLNHLK